MRLLLSVQLVIFPSQNIPLFGITHCSIDKLLPFVHELPSHIILGAIFYNIIAKLGPTRSVK